MAFAIGEARTSGFLLSNLAPVGPNRFCVVITFATKQLYPKFLLDWWGPFTSRLKSSFFTRRAPRIRAGGSLLRRPVKSDRNTSM
jgi:hypothetical protein